MFRLAALPQGLPMGRQESHRSFAAHIGDQLPTASDSLGRPTDARKHFEGIPVAARKALNPAWGGILVDTRECLNHLRTIEGLRPRSRMYIKPPEI